MDYIVDNFEYRYRPVLWLNRTNLLPFWDELDDLYVCHQGKLFSNGALIDAWVQRFLKGAWARYPPISHQVIIKII